ncbi:MAG: hypothetical protein DRR04_03140 [Gammaproteobacteria bacterium]|nr:MAG: hypothetical protein DRQ97_06060 [Gammaproteobacteria bacterium]RLA61361.1 MAG: hypothetical protein DRR04_03140 [Gammaproteobacteria bacterium]
MLALALPGSAVAGTETEQEVEYLLEFVADSGCTFVRNGDDHDSADAADHLRLKYSRGKRHVGSAEQFIDRLATESSWSGDPYTVTCEGKTQASAQWLHQALAGYRQRAAAPAFEP